MLWKIALKNIIYRPLNSILCVSLILFGTGIISLLIILQSQFEEKFERDLQGIDLVVGAKGSPLQLALSAIYHIDAPTGNIDYDEAKQIMNDSIVELAIPLSYGDNFNGYRILGTTEEYINLYKAEIAEGRTNKNSMETVVGFNAAQEQNLTIGDEFISTHGESYSGHAHENKPYVVVGILKQSNSPIDNLILTPIESLWNVHSDNSHGSDHHSDGNHEGSKKQITAVLIKCKAKIALINFPRKINRETNMQAVLPGLELNRLFRLLGIGATTIKLLAGVVILMAAFSVFLVLLSRLKERKYELALMRSVGYKSIDLSYLLIIEGTLLALFGYILGILFSRLGLHFINIQAESDFKFRFDYSFTYGEWNLLIFILALGMLSSLAPAWKAMKMNVSEILQRKN